MANHPIPDLSTLLSSSQIFSSAYPLPHIRAIHKALHAEIDDKQSRLRTQVGGSYRELLGTADTIVQMRGDMESVQLTLGRMGSKCGRQVVKEKMDGLKSWEEADGVATMRRREAARVKILEGCVLGVQKLLRREEKKVRGDNHKRRGGKVAEEKEVMAMSKGDKLLLATKVCVLGKLLVKTLEREGGIHHDEALRTAVMSANRSLVVLRDRLLRCIDSVLVSVNEKLTPRSDLLKALSAYGLHTGSGARDTLRYFLRVRGNALAMSIGNWEGQQQPSLPASAAVRTPKDILRRLNLYAKTLQDVQALTPSKLADALAGLKKKALLADDALRAIEGLRLDIYSRWCGDEIRYYTPFIQHDDLQPQDVNGLLFEWAPVHRDIFIDDLGKTVKSMGELKAIVDLRTSVLRLWIAESSRVRYDYSPDDDGEKDDGDIRESTSMFNQLRSTINDHLLSVIDTKVHKLRLVGSEASAALAAWREGTTDTHLSLWDPSTFSGIDLTVPSGSSTGGNGGGGAAAQFATEVISRLYGRNDAVSKAVASYKSWFHVIDDVGSVVEQLRRQRWENDGLDDDDDEQDMMMVEDEETIEQRQQLLSREDPERLTSHLSDSLVKAFAALDEHLTDLWDKKKQQKEVAGPNNNGQVAMYLLRLLRDIRSRLPEQQQHGHDEGKGIRKFGLRTIPSLHSLLAKTVLVSPVDEFVTVALARKSVVGRGLWEGSPELPTSPSPGMFRFLRNLSAAMADAGADLWSPAAVRELKKEVRGEVCRVWLEAARGVLSEVEEAAKESSEVKVEVEGEKKEAEGEGEKKDDKGGELGEEEGGESDKGAEGEEEKETKQDTEEAKPEEDDKSSEQQAKAEAKALIRQEDDEKASQQRRDLFVQWLLDIIYLGIFLDGRNGDFNEIANTVFQHSGLAPGDKGRLVKAAQEYYKRTQLLFGLLT
ncbi:hypothetical protein SMACR_06692 [Sordaria macrospora]|uniref:Conserved oligomeric Golgi complex subunit 1 n=2 Tax=Sordaria macrospora TaxID=5147 RepID=F7VYC6_SORMK|nr:uncharacterized protein SMAC_06692 [Sordaria macrospora k-hell]KAA8628953.1 hypothetical protein SMACR_06692 [Sordaria macrospora]WPJ62961.1 hypothetical protein SMAC4_06692 [Sordaria macrospora]CCC10520.1 unnamed protein product [Sordaria macrospora k-hell]